MLALERIFLELFTQTKEKEIIRLIWRDIRHNPEPPYILVSDRNISYALYQYRSC